MFEILLNYVFLLNQRSNFNLMDFFTGMSYKQNPIYHKKIRANISSVYGLDSPKIPFEDLEIGSE